MPNKGKPVEIVLDRKSLITVSTANALHTLIANGMTKRQALIKLGIHQSLMRQITKIADTYIGYFDQSEDKYIEEYEKNSPKSRSYIDACIQISVLADEAEAAFAQLCVDSVTAGIADNPELALKVLERRFGSEWAAKKETNVKIDATSVIKTIQVEVPAAVTIEATDAEYEEV